MSEQIEIDLDALERAAKAATPGPWMRLFGERTVYDRMEDGCRGVSIVRADQGWNMQDGANLDFIAAANPAVVLELVRRLREAERLCATVNTCRDALQKVQTRCAGEAFPNWENTQRTGDSRSWILDRTNWALAACDAAVGEPK